MGVSGGRIVVLNGVPRAGKSSIAGQIQALDAEIWVNLGVDSSIASLSPQARPGIGLRPGGERPDLEPLVLNLYRALFESTLAYQKRGLNVVLDVGIHDGYSKPLGILREASSLFRLVPSWLVGVRCSMPEIVRRREEAGMPTSRELIERWEFAVHTPGLYDLEVDTSIQSAEECAREVLAAINHR